MKLWVKMALTRTIVPASHSLMCGIQRVRPGIGLVGKSGVILNAA